MTTDDSLAADHPIETDPTETDPTETDPRLIVEPKPAPRRIPVGDGVELAGWEWTGPERPFVLVHGLASNALMWQGAAAALHRAGHHVLAVDLRGHGRSAGLAAAGDGVEITLSRVSQDLETVLDVVIEGTDRIERAESARRPVLVGQSWGGNVVVRVASSRSGKIAAVAAVDGGHIDLAERFGSWEACYDALAPRRAARPVDEIEAELRSSPVDWPETAIQGALACYSVDRAALALPTLQLDHHLGILRDLYEHPPGPDLASVDVPALLIPAGSAQAPGEWAQGPRSSVDRALDRLPRGHVEWIDGHHDLHAQFPTEVAELLVAFAGGLDDDDETQQRMRTDQR